MKKLFNIFIFCIQGTLVFGQAPIGKIGIFNTLSNIGGPSVPAKVLYSEPDQSYRLSGSGDNIWFGSDSFSFLSKPMAGDFSIQARLAFPKAGHDPHRKAGLMMRSSNASDAAMVACTVHGDGLTSLQYRTKDGGDVQEIKFDLTMANVLQLEKKGTTFTMSVAVFGNNYQAHHITDIELGREIQTGLFICSHNNSYEEEAVFDNVRLYNTVPDDLVQYRTYLGSLLEVMDIGTGDRQVLAHDTGSWQAPNWTPDGKTLIYNADGKLYNFDLATKTSSVLNTDFATRNNNDHVLSFDGKQIGISHHPEEAQGKSIIYTLPVTGGVPKRVTEKGPSYLHGWSPDHKYVIYTAERNGAYNIYKIAVDGGKEIQLTNTPGLDDGSEYAPDGKYIYFNSTRTGTMQLWRMDANGKNPKQLTFDELNDWFPHVSPDNKWLVFVSFPKEVAPDKHPFYERVYLRLMPIEGGEIKTIAYLYGGQGTINVPSWSPDSKKIAFVSNGNFSTE